MASNLAATARRRREEAVERRDELARLFDLSRDVLLITDSREAMATLARAIARRFDLEFVAIALPRASDWDVFEGGSVSVALDTRQLSSAFAAAQTSLEFDAYARTYAGHRTMEVDGRTIRLVPLRVGTRPVGVLAAGGRPVEAGTLDALAGVVAIGIERAQFLEERKASELTRQSEELKTALLASLGHDLRTPLTAIRIAASNLKAGRLAPGEQLEQSDVILSEVERLTRLFQNVLEMARLDAGAVATAARWTHPSEIIEAARDQVGQTLAAAQARRDRVHGRAREARSSPHGDGHRPSAGERGSVCARATRPSKCERDLTDEGLMVAVRDHGPGIAAADLPHLFERFYRGDASRTRASGTGMGLWIARGLLAVERGRVWAENRADGGAQFTIVVPAEVKAMAGEGASVS